MKTISFIFTDFYLPGDEPTHVDLLPTAHICSMVAGGEYHSTEFANHWGIFDPEAYMEKLYEQAQIA